MTRTMLTEFDAIRLAQEYLLLHPECGCGNSDFAHFIPANSSDIFDPKYPDDHWAVFFSIPFEEIEPPFFVLNVNCRTFEVTQACVM